MPFLKKTNKAKQDNSFEALIQNEQEKLYRVAYSYVKNEQDALDIVQEAIIKGYKSFEKLKEIDFFSTWMTRILINTAIDYLKRKKEVIPINYDWMTTINREDDFSVFGLDMERVFEKLKPQQKTLVLLRFYYGYSIPEIADFLKKPEGTIKSQLHRTLQKMKGELGRGGDMYGELSTRY